jgi:hypothetical protein
VTGFQLHAAHEICSLVRLNVGFDAANGYGTSVPSWVFKVTILGAPGLLSLDDRLFARTRFQASLAVTMPALICSKSRGDSFCTVITCLAIVAPTPAPFATCSSTPPDAVSGAGDLADVVADDAFGNSLARLRSRASSLRRMP